MQRSDPTPVAATQRALAPSLWRTEGQDSIRYLAQREEQLRLENICC
jgi:hypothetical protein